MKTFSIRRVLLLSAFFATCGLGGLHWSERVDLVEWVLAPTQRADTEHVFVEPARVQAEPRRVAVSQPEPEPAVETFHGVLPQIFCSRPQTTALKETRKSVVVQSRDSSGRVIFSDRAPAGARIESTTEYRSVERVPFDVDIREAGKPLPPLVLF